MALRAAGLLALGLASAAAFTASPSWHRHSARSIAGRSGRGSNVRMYTQEEDDMGAYFAAHPTQTTIFASIVQPGAPAEAYLEEYKALLAGGVAEPERLAMDAQDRADNDNELLLKVISFLQQNLVKAGDEDGEPEDDPDFIAEGRKILALDRFMVEDMESDMFLIEKLWEEIGGLVRKGNSETGTLVMLPKFTGGDVRPIIASMVNPALGWLGLEERIKVDSFRMMDGAPCPMVRILYDVDTAAVGGLDGGGEETAEGFPASAEEQYQAMLTGRPYSVTNPPPPMPKVVADAAAGGGGGGGGGGSDVADADGPERLNELLMNGIGMERLSRIFKL